MDIVERLRKDPDYLGKVYLENKEYCLNFMGRMYQDREVLNDVYQDAIIVLYENSLKENFKLSCSTQTYLNSICRNQLLNKFKSKVSTLNISDEYLPELNHWYDDFELEKENKLVAIESALDLMKKKGEKCYDILHRYYYLKQSMQEIALALNYTNDKNAKNQKLKCKKKLVELSKNNLVHQ